ncbi:hypothetical protein IV203_004313 [Nitzschia inconspicua]|uniref:Uncharacterized protein n=1 Tax=Nitzschia inconspicua TaxID=303405 RepID=A0A9K3PPJ6_9STRA|nr:hypothetical protein IV203_004313 [Nitzschia inconspicua]
MSLEKRLHEAMAQHQKILSQADQNSKSLKEMLAIERQEQQRLVNECAKLVKQLHESGEQNERFVSQVKTLSDLVVELLLKLDGIEIEHLKAQDDLLRRCHELEQQLQLNVKGIRNQKNQMVEEKVADMKEGIQGITERNANLEAQITLYKENIEESADRYDMDEEIQGLKERKAYFEAQIALYKETIEECTDNNDREKFLRRCTALEQELSETMELNEELTKQVTPWVERVREAPSDGDFSQLLDRCTDLEAEKATIEYELKQHKNDTAEITKESDELQEKLDAALAELVELQQMRDQDLIVAHKSREMLEALVDANDELMMNSRIYWMKP